MSADLLREAAREIRHDTFNGQTEDAQFMEAVADWLEHEADHFDMDDTTRTRAIAVARSYLGRDA